MTNPVTRSTVFEKDDQLEIVSDEKEENAPDPLTLLESPDIKTQFRGMSALSKKKPGEDKKKPDEDKKMQLVFAKVGELFNKGNETLTRMVGAKFQAPWPPLAHDEQAL